jgi:drug/metabolite transporter (DMT)-like permease
VKRSTYPYLLITVFLWGTTYAASYNLIQPFGPLTPISYVFGRVFWGTLMLAILLIASRKMGKVKKIFKNNYKRIIFLGVFCFSTAYFVQYTALVRSTAINQSILLNLQTFAVIILSAIFFKNSVKPLFIFAACLAFIGFLFIMSKNGSVEVEFNEETIDGDLLSLLAAFLWGAFITWSKDLASKEPPLLVAFCIELTALIFLTPIALIQGLPEQVILMSIPQFFILVYLGVFCIGFAYFFYYNALSDPELKPEHAAITSFLQPIVGITTSILWLGESLYLNTVIGCVIIIFSLYLAHKTQIKEHNPE